MSSIKEKILEKVIGDVKKMNGAGGKLFNEATASSVGIESNEDKENMINTPFSSQTSLESKDMENRTMDDRDHISKDMLGKPIVGHLEKVNIKTPRRSILRIQNYNTPGKYECTGVVTPNDAGYTLRKGGYPLRKGRKPVTPSLKK